MAESAGNPAFLHLPSVHHHDVDELRHAVSGSNLEVIQLQPGRLDVTLGHVSITDLSMDVGTANLPLRVRGGLDPGRFSIGAFFPGSRATWNGNHVDASRILLAAPGKELNGHLLGAYNYISLVVPLDWMASMAQTAWRSNALQLAGGCRAHRPRHDRLADLWQAVSSIATTARGPLNLDSAEWLRTDLRNALGAMLSELDVPAGKVMSRSLAHYSIARRAERYLQERIAEPVCINDLCVAMHASRRYLEYAFTDAFGTSPSRYLRLLRLHAVRHRLKSLGAGTTVTDEALRLGFSHLSLFSTQYREAFGESPSETIAQAAHRVGRQHLLNPSSGFHADSR